MVDDQRCGDHSVCEPDVAFQDDLVALAKVSVVECKKCEGWNANDQQYGQINADILYFIWLITEALRNIQWIGIKSILSSQDGSWQTHKHYAQADDHADELYFCTNRLLSC